MNHILLASPLAFAVGRRTAAILHDTGAFRSASIARAIHFVVIGIKEALARAIHFVVIGIKEAHFGDLLLEGLSGDESSLALEFLHAAIEAKECSVSIAIMCVKTEDASL